MATTEATVTHIEIVFDTYDFWVGEGWHEDNYIDRIDTSASEAKYHGLVCAELARLWECEVSWETKESGTGNDVYVTFSGESGDDETENGIVADFQSVQTEIYQDYESWVVE